MPKITLLFNLFVILLILGLVYVVTLYGKPIRSMIQTTKTAVAGVSTSTSREDLQNTLPHDLQADVKTNVAQVKENVAAVSLGEIFSFFQRTGKIIDDLHSLQNTVKENVTDNDSHE